MRIQDLSPIQMFTSSKLVNNSLFNLAGAQVARTVMARALYTARPKRRSSQTLHPQFQTLDRDGVVIIEDFLDGPVFDLIVAQATAVIQSGDPNIQEKTHGPTRYHFARYKDFRSQLDALESFYGDPRLVSLLEYAERRKLNMDATHRGVERVTQGAETTLGDPETDLHSDIFYNTFKAWLYLTDVRPEDAPLVFVRRSHHLSFEQLKQIYLHSRDPKQSSRRIVERELHRLGLKEDTFTCKKNTLVVANVCGYHRRCIGKPGGQRMALHCSVRSQPFLNF
jgi:hypothetical protein